MQERYIQSVNLKQTTDFPYLVLDGRDGDSHPRNPGFHVMHWHEDLQFIYMLRGHLDIVTLDACVTLRQGEGIFINKNVVHLVRQSDNCHHKSFIFPEHFLKFYFGSPASTVVEQIVGQRDLSVFHLTDSEGNRPALEALRRLSALEETERTPLYAYEVLTTLCVLWLSFCRVVSIPAPRPEKRLTQQRMAVFLRYIEQHYGDELTLESLARSANVSKSECLRCFKTSLQTTPYKYLIEYRLSRAAELLCTTDAPIGEVAAQVCFQHTSHFGKCFREKTGMSPSAFRKAR